MLDLIEQDDNQTTEEMFFGDKQARDFQIGSLKQIENAFTNGAKRVCLVSPTGSGKTINCGLILISPVIRALVGLSNHTDAKGHFVEKIRVLFVAHRNRLLQQAVRTFAAECGIELIPQSCFSPISDELIERGWDITVLDESHHESMITIQNQLDNMTQSSTHKMGFIPLLGLTATPDRADGCIIKFDTIITAITRDEAVRLGYLAKSNLYTFVDSTSRNNKVNMIDDIITTYSHLIGRGIIFVSTRDEATQLATLIRANTSKRVVNVCFMSDSLLNNVLDEFSAGKWDLIINCDKLGEGVDVIGCDSVFIGRTVGSFPLLNQYIGRAARPDSECNIFCLVNPLTDNLDPTVVIGTPEVHKLIYKRGGKWTERDFAPVTNIIDEAFSGKSLVMAR